MLFPDLPTAPTAGIAGFGKWWFCVCFIWWFCKPSSPLVSAFLKLRPQGLNQSLLQRQLLHPQDHVKCYFLYQLTFTMPFVSTVHSSGLHVSRHGLSMVLTADKRCCLLGSLTHYLGFFSCHTIMNWGYPVFILRYKKMKNSPLLWCVSQGPPSLKKHILSFVFKVFCLMFNFVFLTAAYSCHCNCAYTSSIFVHNVHRTSQFSF